MKRFAPNNLDHYDIILSTYVGTDAYLFLAIHTCQDSIKKPKRVIIFKGLCDNPFYWLQHIHKISTSVLEIRIRNWSAVFKKLDIL